MSIFFRFCIGSLILFLPFRSMAQKADFYDVMHDLQLVKQSLQSDSGQYVACNMTFLYSMESTPLKFIDSLQGKYRSAGRLRYVSMANMENIQNDSMVLTIYNDDKVLMVVKKVASSDVHMGQGLLLNNIDSGFIMKNVDTVSITISGSLKIMKFKFTASSPYYNCVLTYNATTYVPASLTYILKQSKLAESGKPVPDGSLITIRYSGYTTAAFDPSFLNVNKYIQMDIQGKASAQSTYGSFNVIQQ
jgi:hypothetical protein